MNFQQIYRDFLPLIKSILYKMGYKGMDAEDLTQEIACKIYLNLDKYNKDKAALSTWVSTIAKRTCIDYSRSRGYKNNLCNDDLTVVNDTHESEEKADRFIQELMCKSLIAKALNELSKRHEIVLRMFYLEQMHYKEIADELGLSTSRIGIEKIRAEANLRRVVGNFGYTKNMLY